MNTTMISLGVAGIVVAAGMVSCGVQRLGAAKKEIGSLQTTVEACLIAAQKREQARKGALNRVRKAIAKPIVLPDGNQNEIEKHL